MIELRDTNARWAASSALRATRTARALFAGGCGDASRTSLEHAELIASDDHWTEPLVEPIWLDAAGADLMRAVASGRSGQSLASAFSRRLGDRVLSFAASEDGRILDRETARTGSFTAKAVADARAGEELDYVSSGAEEWYIWAAHHPGTGIFGPETVQGSRS